MAIYIILFLYLLIVALLTRNKIICYSNIFILVFILTIRGIEVGTDYVSYLDIYRDIGINGYYGYPEPLYGYLTFIFNVLGASFELFQCLLSILFFTLCIIVARQYVTNQNLFLFFLYALLFIFYFMNINRQILAVSVIFLGYHFLYKKRYFGYCLCVLSATLLHYSALVAILVLFVLKIKINRKYLFISLIISLIVGFSFIESLRGLGVFGKYEHYLDSDIYGLRPHDIFMYRILLYRICWSALCFLICSTIKKEYSNYLWLKIYILSVILDNLMMQISLGSRIVFYFSIAQTIVYPIYLCNNKFKPNWIPYIAIIGVTALFFGVFLYNNACDIIPYKTL